jgi:hypothetical protein
LSLTVVTETHTPVLPDRTCVHNGTAGLISPQLPLPALL